MGENTWRINITCPRCQFRADVEEEFPCGHSAELARLKAELKGVRASDAAWKEQCANLDECWTKDRTRAERAEAELARLKQEVENWMSEAAGSEVRAERAEAELAQAVIRAEKAEAQVAELTKPWSEDKRDEYSDRISAAFPTESGSHEEYALAMKLVGNRHSKGALVGLVNWLLVESGRLRSALEYALSQIESSETGDSRTLIAVALSLRETLSPTPAGERDCVCIGDATGIERYCRTHGGDAMARWWRESGNAEFWNKVECIECELGRDCDRHPEPAPPEREEGE